MRSATILLLQAVVVALVAPSWAITQFGPSGAYRFQDSFGGDNIPVTTLKPKTPTFQIVANEDIPVGPVPQRTPRQRVEDEETLRRQAESAKYTFAASLNDRIMDGEHVRQENRDGLKTTGMYSYSDGFFRRTVEYVADENGYRVIKQTVEPIGDGPQPDPSGSADVAAFYDRSKLQYSITTDDIRGYPTPEDYEIAAGRRDLFTPPNTPIFARTNIPSHPTEVDDYTTTTTENVLRAVERHEVQIPARPPPFLRGAHLVRNFRR